MQQQEDLEDKWRRQYHNRRMQCGVEDEELDKILREMPNKLWARGQEIREKEDMREKERQTSWERKRFEEYAIEQQWIEEWIKRRRYTLVGGK